jgi:ketosteroid isomerase-like protein
MMDVAERAAANVATIEKLLALHSFNPESPLDEERLAAIEALYHEDFVMRILYRRKRYEGRAAFMREVMGRSTALHPTFFEQRMIQAYPCLDPDYVFAELRSDADQVDGGTFAQHFMSMFRFEGGRIIQWDQWCDSQPGLHYDEP